MKYALTYDFIGIREEFETVEELLERYYNLDCDTFVTAWDGDEIFAPWYK